MFGDGIQYPFDGACLNHVTVGTTSIHCYEGNSINYESSLSNIVDVQLQKPKNPLLLCLGRALAIYYLKHFHSTVVLFMIFHLES